ncbi:hypothetical protein [Verrucomicrobium sp. BvORR106]|uniref:hypothetical protein n=1 Tax=Verrucomicrobium sp. BvORR106 TaxID=1403819 RepID=UPI000571C6E6|nr:hypothetical protein [Verrucomicrobium sp. BvORR106]
MSFRSPKPALLVTVFLLGAGAGWLGFHLASKPVLEKPAVNFISGPTVPKLDPDSYAKLYASARQDVPRSLHDLGVYEYHSMVGKNGYAGNQLFGMLLLERSSALGNVESSRVLLPIYLGTKDVQSLAKAHRIVDSLSQNKSFVSNQSNVLFLEKQKQLIDQLRLKIEPQHSQDTKE